MKTVKIIKILFFLLMTTMITTSCHDNCQRYQLSAEGERVLDTKDGILYVIDPTRGVYSSVDIKQDTIFFGKASK